MDQWAPRLDLFHPEYPAFQCGGLTQYNRGAHHLDPAALGGEVADWFNAKVSIARAGVAAYPAWEPAEAARKLLWLLSYDTAGIKRAAPGDPLAQRGKTYGARPGPAGIVTHLHVEGHTLKDVLLLALPPHRTAGDAPVWEQPPPTAVRTREPRGRLDWLTWPTRRVRLRPPAEDGAGVDRFALHDGDRIPGDAWALAHAYDPMTAWSTPASGRGRSPLRFTDESLGVPKPWTAALLLEPTATPRPQSSAVLQHAVEAAARGVIPPDTRLRAVFSGIEWGTQRAVISNDSVAVIELGTAGQLTDPDQRGVMAARARYAEAVQSNLRRATREISGRPVDMVRKRMTLTNLDYAWERTTAPDCTREASAREAATKEWRDTLREAAETLIYQFPMDPRLQAKLSQTCMNAAPPAEESSQGAARRAEPRRPRRTPPATRGPGRPAGGTYEAFGGRYTLSQISNLEQCVVSYNTLRNRLTDPEHSDRRWTPQEVEEAATRPAARGRRRTTGSDQ
ncbi:type I-E CRISPR-associated protein Cse1/CasA (plasmid) [Streptomyces californicus]|uniref:Type I-E CRISPR-associated protein Cse1/CasA n=1 Tax=Streptomyces californicus TaxID=67351 RepID=A0ABX7JDH3_9ACTN|nr:type I-E CRISPR-associated protein Cse1/CasA [Streptomyces californicus]QRV45991.1 type I-E CRISPR-associated protein Cse1/CasA [Streptomyces californicus]